MRTRVLAAALAATFLATAAGAATPRRGGTIVVVLPAAKACLNPFRQCGLGGRDLTQVLEGASEIGPDLVFRPSLVSRVTIGRNPFTLTYHIRPEARWNDGVPVSAADFRYTYQTFAAHETTSQFRPESYDRIRRVRVLGAKTFRVELREPYADWRHMFDLVLPSHALAGEDFTAAALWRDRIDNPKTGRPIGSGPFLVSRLEPGRQLILARNRSYWGGHRAYVDRLVFRFGGFDPADPLGPLRRNEIQLTAALDAAQAADAARIPGWRVVPWPALTQELLVFRSGPGGHPALRNRLVRRALAHGIDRVELARRINSQLGRRARPLDSTAFFPGERAYRPNWSTYRYDPARARRLLQQAGCRRGADLIYTCAGQRLRLRFFTTAGQARREHALRLIKEQLLAAGVDVETTYVPSPAFFGTLLPGGEFDAVLFSWVSEHGGTVVPEAICGLQLNYSRYCSRLTQRDVQQVARIVDAAARARLLNTIDVKLVRDVPLLPLFQTPVNVALRDKLKGFVQGGNFSTMFEHTEDWWLAP